MSDVIPIEPAQLRDSLRIRLMRRKPGKPVHGTVPGKPNTLRCGSQVRRMHRMGSARLSDRYLTHVVTCETCREGFRADREKHEEAVNG